MGGESASSPRPNQAEENASSRSDASSRSADRRVRRTERAITKAYVTIRARGDRITVKGLCELADINKTTFYEHYRDLADLQEALERRLVEGFVGDIAHPDYLVSDDQAGMLEVTRAFARRRQLIMRLYPPERLPALAHRVEEELERRISELRPELACDREHRVLLTFLVRGSFDAFFAHLADGDVDELAVVIGNIRQCLVRAYEPLGNDVGANPAGDGRA